MSATANIESLRLNVCPACRYDLTGLPRRHQCPECGFNYDEQTFAVAVWQTSDVPSIVSTVLYAVLFLFAFSMAFGTRQWLYGVMAVAMGIACFRSAQRYWLKLQRRSDGILIADGVGLASYGADEEVHRRWRELLETSLKRYRSGWRLQAYANRWRRLWCIDIDVVLFSDQKSAQAIQAECQRRIEESHAQDPTKDEEVSR